MNNRTLLSNLPSSSPCPNPLDSLPPPIALLNPSNSEYITIFGIRADDLEPLSQHGEAQILVASIGEIVGPGAANRRAHQGDPSAEHHHPDGGGITNGTQLGGDGAQGVQADNGGGGGRVMKQGGVVTWPSTPNCLRLCAGNQTCGVSPVASHTRAVHDIFF